MEAFAYRLMQADYSSPMLLSWGIWFSFAAIVVFLVKPNFRLSRPAYFFFMGLCMLLFGVRYIVDSSFRDAVTNDYLFKLMLASYSCTISGVTLLGLCSAARSNDAYGHWRNWYLGFIPLVSFVLLFKPPQIPGKSGFARLAANVVLVILGLFLFGAGRAPIFAGLNSPQVASVQNDAQFQEKVRQYELQNRGVNGLVQELAKSTQYPYTIDKYTVLTSAQADGATFRLVYKRASLSEPYPQVMLSQKTHELCTQPDSIGLMDKGITIEKQYIGNGDVPLGEVRGSKELCAQMQAKIPQIVQGIVDSFKMVRLVDDDTTWTGTEYKGGQFDVYYDYTGDKKNIKWDDVEYRLCGQFSFVLSFGVDVRAVYRTPDKTELADRIVTDASCMASRK